MDKHWQQLARSYLIQTSGPTDRELIEAYQAGASILQVAARYGLSQDAAGRRLRAAGCPMRARGSNRIEIPAEELRRMVSAGASLAVMARRFGTTKTTIANRLRGLGIDRPQQGQIPLNSGGH